MSDDINRIIGEALADHNRIIGYECRDCGNQYCSGREARKHMFKEHDNPIGLRKVTEGDDE